jgi:predicted enzyme related to lactoylglutathione lyase
VITSVAFTTVNCIDQERARTFYTEMLGFEPYRDEPMGESGAGRWIEVGPKGAATRLVLFPDAGQAGGFTAFVLDTDDIVATCAELAERGVEITAQPRVEAWGSWWAQIKDSEGNEIGLAQRGTGSRS